MTPWFPVSHTYAGSTLVHHDSESKERLAAFHKYLPVRSFLQWCNLTYITSAHWNFVGGGRGEFFISPTLWLTRTANATQGTATGQKQRGKKVMPVGNSTGGHLEVLHSLILQTNLHGFTRQQQRSCPTLYHHQPRTSWAGLLTSGSQCDEN